MREKLRFLGLDVHAETTAVAVAEPDGEVRTLGTIANRKESIHKLVKRLGPPEQLLPASHRGQRNPSGHRRSNRYFRQA
jgi:hypothetical protein